MKMQLAAALSFTLCMSFRVSGDLLYLTDNRNSYYSAYDTPSQTTYPNTPFEDFEASQLKSTYISGIVGAYAVEGEYWEKGRSILDIEFRLTETTEVSITGTLTSDNWYYGWAEALFSLKKGTEEIYSMGAWDITTEELSYNGTLAPGDYTIKATPDADIVGNASIDFRADFAAIPEPTSGALILMSIGIFGLRKARIRRDDNQPYPISRDRAGRR